MEKPFLLKGDLDMERKTKNTKEVLYENGGFSKQGERKKKRAPVMPNKFLEKPEHVWQKHL